MTDHRLRWSAPLGLVGRRKIGRFGTRGSEEGLTPVVKSGVDVAEGDFRRDVIGRGEGCGDLFRRCAGAMFEPDLASGRIKEKKGFEVRAA